MIRVVALLLLTLAAATGAAGAPAIRTATPADDGAHPGPGARTEWWFVGARDVGRGLTVAIALGPTFPSAPAATVVFLYLPDGGVHVVAAPRVVTPPPATDRADVRLPPDRLWSPRPGLTRVRVDIDRGVALHGDDPGPVRVDLTVRATVPGFAAGPLELPEGQNLSWTVGAPAARVSGTVVVAGRTHRLHDAPGYHDHNHGEFDLADDAHGGWDWSWLDLPGDRSLVSGIVRPADPFPRSGVMVLSGPRGRTATADARRVTVRRARWSRVGPHVYPRALHVRARLSGGWTATVRWRARRAAPLTFGLDGRSALVEVEATAAGELRRGGRVVERWTAAPGLYEYESTPVTRERDAAPGSVAWLAREVGRAAGALARAAKET